MHAAATTGPAKGPRPASSVPQRTRMPASLNCLSKSSVSIGVGSFVRAFSGDFQGNTPDFAAAEFIKQHSCGAFGIDLAAADEVAALTSDEGEQLMPLQIEQRCRITELVSCAECSRRNLKKSEAEKTAITNDGILFCSGMIAGEGIVGILLALLAVFGIDKAIDVSGMLGLSEPVANIASLVVFALIILSVLKFSVWKKRSK